MSNSLKALNLAKENNGIITCKMANKNGISNSILAYLVKKGQLELSDVGIYVLTGTLDDPYFNFQNRFNNSVFSHLTALDLLDLTDINPNTISATFPQGYNYPVLRKSDYDLHFVKKEILPLGVIETKTIFGNTVRCYNMERTLCDIVSVKAMTDIRVINDAFRLYIQRKDKDLNRLAEYSRIRKVEKQIRKYIEVLL